MYVYIYTRSLIYDLYLLFHTYANLVNEEVCLDTC